MQSLERLCNWIVRLSMTRPDFFEEASVVGIIPKKIPEEFYARTVIDSFILDSKENNQKFALYRKLKWIEEIDKDIGVDAITWPKKIAEIGPVFHKLYKHWVVTKLGKALMSEPEDADKIIGNYYADQSEGVKVWSVQSGYEDFMKQHFEKGSLDEISVEIPNFPKLSSVIGGFNPNRLILLLANTGFGKTALALNFAIGSSEKKGVLFVNMEMENYDFFQRILAIKERRTYTELKKKILPTFSGPFYESENLIYTDGTALDMSSIVGLIGLIKRKNKSLGFVVVDYDQKIKLDDSREEEWKQLQRVSIELEEMAKRNNICIILCAQLNRDGEISGSFRTTFAASTVLYFTKDEKHGDTIYTLKNRFGERGAGVAVNYERAMSVITEGVEITKDFSNRKIPRAS